MLKKISIKGLRGFGTTEEIEFSLPNNKPGSGLNIIVGSNNSGKTTLIEAIKCYNVESENISFSEGKRNEKNSHMIEISYFDENNKKIELKSIESNKSQVAINGTRNKNNIPYTLPARRYVDYKMGNSGNYYFDRINYSSGLVKYTKNRMSDLSQFSQRIFKWQKNKENFDNYLKQIITEPFDWEIEQYDDGTYYIKISFSNNLIQHNREGIGDGYWSIFTIVDALYDSKAGGIILIDEPELSLHPNFQRRVIKLLEDFSKDRQIIIATHSPYFISLNALINGGKLLRTFKDKNGNIKIGTLKSNDKEFIESLTNNLNNPHILGLEAKELFFLDDDIIITEGQEDVVIYPKICQELGIKLNANLFGWGAGGADNISKVLNMLQNLGYEKVTAIFDGDKESEFKKCKMAYPSYNILLLFKDDIRDKKEINKSAKKGIADEKGNIKDENIDKFKELIYKINDYHKN